MSKPHRLSLDVISWLDCIWKTELPSASKLIAAYLRSYMNSKHDMAWPSLSRIVKETGLGQSTVCKHLDFMEVSGWIKRNRGHGGAVTKSTEYIACFPVSWEKAIAQIEVDNGLPSPPNREAPLHQTEIPSPPNGVDPLHQTDTNNQCLNKQENNQERAQLPRKDKMSVQWTPNKDLLSAVCKRSGVQPTIVTVSALAEFVTYWADEQGYFSESQWIQKLITSAQKHALRNPTTRPIEKPDPDKPSALALKMHREMYPDQYANEVES